VTLNDVFLFADAGLETVTPVTLMSEVARIFVLELLLPELFPGVGSDTCSWSTVTLAEAEKL
jgi:hypothetical protein